MSGIVNGLNSELRSSHTGPDRRRDAKGPWAVFISYAHVDSIELAERFERDLNSRSLPAWRDTSRLHGGDVWTSEIEEAIDSAPVMVVLLSRAAFRSDICRAEQLRALRRGACVIPVLVQADADRPLHLETRQYIDFSPNANYDQMFELLLDSIRERKSATLPARYRQTLVSLPNLPLNFVDRPDERNALRNLLLAESGSRQVAVTALQGMGGIGKTVLANALCQNEPMLRDAFPDGVAWVSIGRESANLVEKLKRLASNLGMATDAFSELDSAVVHLRSFVRDKALLLVLDDVWEAGSVEHFRVEDAPRYRLLFTTRKPKIAAELGAQAYPVGTLSPELSLVLLSQRAAMKVEDLPPAAHEIVKECGGLPLALAMIGAKLRNRIASYWADTLDDLRRARIGCITGDRDLYGYESLKAAFEVSLADLDPALKKRYFELAVFPEDIAILEAPLAILWGIASREVRQTTAELADLSLLSELSQPIGAAQEVAGALPDWGVTLHDLQFDFLRDGLGELRLKLLQQEFLIAYRKKCADGWHTGPRDDSYFFRGLLYHLRAAGRDDEAWKLLFDFNWIEAKLDATEVASMAADYEVLPKGEDYSLVHEAIQLSAHVLASDKSQLAGQLLGRLSDRSHEIRGMLEQARLWSAKAWLRPLTPTLVQPGGPLLRTLAGHTRSVWALAVTSDRKRVISGSVDGTLKVWDLASGNELSTLAGHTSPVCAIAVTPDDQQVLSASLDGTLMIWDLASGKALQSLKGSKNLLRHAVAMTPDGKRVVSSCGDPQLRRSERAHDLKVWDLKSGEDVWILTGHLNEICAVAVTLDGTRAVSASLDQTLKVWDLTTGGELWTLRGHTHSVNAVALTADNRGAVSGSSDGTVRVWDLESGEEVFTLAGPRCNVWGVAVTPDGQQAISASGVFEPDLDQTLKLWDLTIGRQLGTLPGHSGAIYAVAVMPDGHTAVSGSWDKTLKVWDLTRSERGVGVRNHSDLVPSVAVTSDGSWVLSASWDGTLRVWERSTGKLVRTLVGHSYAIQSVAVASDGRRAVSASSDHTLKLWDLASGKELRTLTGHSGSVYAVKILPDGLRAVSASADRTLKVWDLRDGRELRTLRGHEREVFTLALMPDGRQVLSGSLDETLRLWDITSGRELQVLPTNGMLTTVALAPDGQRAFSAPWGNSSIHIWDVASGRELRTVSVHTGGVRGIAVMQGGQLAVSASQDHTLKVWTVKSGEVVATFTADRSLYSCAVAPNGTTIVAGDGIGGVHFLELLLP